MRSMPPPQPTTPSRHAAWRAALVVYRKEWVDALRDRRTLLVVLASSVLLGPLVLVALSAVVASLEARAETREVYLLGAEHAPGLVNYLQRQSYTVKAAPADHEAQLRASTLGDPVLVVPARLRSRTAARRSAGADARQRQQQPPAPNRAARACSACCRATAASASPSAWRCAGCRRNCSAPLDVNERDLGGTQGPRPRRSPACCPSS